MVLEQTRSPVDGRLPARTWTGHARLVEEGAMDSASVRYIVGDVEAAIRFHA
jgi:hypothetical protein